jgi:hypothetical protein
MAKNRADDDGVKGGRAKKSDKARRTFELHGQYSQKHLRARAEAACNAAEKSAGKKKGGEKKSR